ncbi:MAG: hypothetical protein RL012_150 [Bacteroidota bacterium]|jgi:hypothetical protein
MVIDLKDIVSISGYSGLFKSIKPTRHGVVVESLDDQKKRSIKQTQDHEMATLEDIGVYTTDKDDTLPLSTILWRLHAEFSALVHTDLYDTPDKLCTLMGRIVPNYDPKRVHTSNIRKIIHWYNILVKHAPEIFSAAV